MSHFRTTDFALEVALGNVPGYRKINKFGQAPDCDNAVLTDIWDGADGSLSSDIWIAPTQARLHDVVSDSANDTSAGTGLRTLRLYGLTDWGSLESSEDIIMNGTSTVTTSNSYVIVHRIKHLTSGSAGPNVGTITATAQTDATITAAIQPDVGQTLMAIYGVPSTQTIRLTYLREDIKRGTGTRTADAFLAVRENADQSGSKFVMKESFQFRNDTPLVRPYKIPKSFSGPCIVKLQVNADTNNTVVSGAFDAYLVDN